MPLPEIEIEFPLGKIYDYGQWTPNSRVTLTNVPWSNTYKDIVRFGNTHVGLDAYIDSKGAANFEVSEMSYAKPNQAIRLGYPFNRINRYNYIRVVNEAQPVIGADIQKNFYYFITNVAYDTPDTTIINVELDAVQTFGYEVQIGNAYVERGHIGVANANSFEDFGRSYLTVPEGLDYGGEYKVVATREQTVMDSDPDGGDYGYDVLIWATSALPISGGTVSAPLLKGSRGSTFQSMPSGAEVYVVRGAEKLQEFMLALSDTPWLGESIIAIKVIPRIDRYVSFDYAPVIPDSKYIYPPQGTLPDKSYNMFTDWRASSEIHDMIPDRYDAVKEKFFVSPYMYLELTTWSGTPILNKPESWADNDATVVERLSLMPPNERIVFIPFKYNAIYGDGKTPGQDDGGEYLDHATYINNLPSVSLVNNGGMLFLGQNAAGLSFAAQSADWSQQKAIESARVARQNVDSTNAAASQATMYQNQADLNSTNNQISGGQAQFAINAATGGGGPSGIMNALRNGGNLVADTAVSAEAFNIRSDTRNSLNENSRYYSEKIADNNQALAQFGAQGDYANSIAGIAAKVQDARLIQPSVSGQTGGEAFNLIHNNVEVSLRVKMIDKAHIKALGEFWLRYGYAVNQTVPNGTIPADWQVMSKFTYWKMQEVYLKAGPMPEIYKNLFVGMLTRGVTVWRDPNDIGVVDMATNAPISGIVF